mgnify:FL=1
MKKNLIGHFKKNMESYIKKYIDTNIFLNGILYDDKKAKEIISIMTNNEYQNSNKTI